MALQLLDRGGGEPGGLGEGEGSKGHRRAQRSRRLPTHRKRLSTFND